MLQASRIYTFLDQEHEFAIHFLEGQKVIHDLALLHHQGPTTFGFFRDAVLSILPMNSFLKAGEGLAVFIDNDDPKFSFKLELHSSGTFRTLLLPEDVQNFPEKFVGNCRVVKSPPTGKLYTSILQLKNDNFQETTNKILTESYQMPSFLHLSSTADQSILLIDLPSTEVDIEKAEKKISLKDYFIKKRTFFEQVFNKALNTETDTIQNFQDENYLYLQSKEIKYFCPCSRERMLVNLSRLGQDDLEHLFDDGRAFVETKCDYCKENYQFSKDELIGKGTIS